MSRMTKESAAGRWRTGVSARGAAQLAGIFAAGFLIGRVHISAQLWPFGLAFVLAAFLHAQRANPYMALSGVLAALATHIGAMDEPAYPFVVLGAAAAVMTVFYCLRLPLRWPVALAAAGAGCLAGLLLLRRTLMLAVLLALAELALCALMLWVIDTALRFLFAGHRRRVLRDDELLALVLTGMLGVMGLGDLGAVGAALAQTLGVLLCLCAAQLGGGMVSGAAGLAMGVSALLCGGEPLLMAAYGFCALTAGACRRLRRLGPALGFFAGDVFLSFFAARQQSLLLPWPAVLAGVVLFLAAPRKWLERLGRYIDQNLMRAHENDLHMQRFRALTTGRLKEIAQVFLNASRVFAQSARRERDGGEIGYALSAIPEQACAGCLFCEKCWQKDLPRTVARMQRLYARFERAGEISLRDLGADFQKRCLAPERLLTAARQVFERYRTNSRWEEKIAESRAMVGEQLEGVSRVISSLLTEVELDIRFRPDLEEAIRLRLDEIGIDLREVSVAMVGGGLQVFLNVRPCRSGGGCAKIAAAVSEVCGTPLWVADRPVACSAVHACGLRLEPARALRVNYGVARVKKEGSPVSGDAYSLCELHDGRYMALLCDGMGSGHQAARESAAAVSLMEDFYRANFDDKTVLDAINKLLLLSSSDEIFSTVDLCMLDLVGSRARFTKIGAPHSYLVREGRMRRLQAGSLPIGILDEFQPAVYETALLPGDLILLFTDGVADLETGSEALFAAIREAANMKSAQEIAERILTMAVAAGGGRAGDDMTVLALRLVRTQAEKSA